MSTHARSPFPRRADLLIPRPGPTFRRLLDPDPGPPELPLALAVPPYEAIRPLDPGAGPLPPGAVVLVQVHSPDAQAAVLEDAVPPLRRRFPAAAVVVLTRPASVPELARLAWRAGRLHARGVLVEGEPLGDTLRQLLIHPADLAADVVEWLPARGVRLPPVLAHMVRQIFTLAPQYTAVADLLAALHEPETSARARFRRRGLPGPAAWLAAARAVHAALALQAQPGRSLLLVALDLGYSDHSVLHRQMRKAFGIRPSEVRGALGWEWLLDRWLARAAAHRRPARGRLASAGAEAA